MERTTVTCVDSNVTVAADVMQKSSRSLKVVLHETTIPMTLYKQTPNDKLYKGSLSGLEFISSGD